MSDFDSPFTIFAVVLAVQLVGAYVGDAFRRKVRPFKEEEREDFDVVRTASLTLLGLIIGFSFSTGPDIRRTIAPKSLEQFKQRIREITRTAKGVSIKTIMEELALYMRGWRGYFGFCETPEVLVALTRWVRLRLRAALWRQWKTPRRRRAALIALGVSGELRNMAGSGRGPWHLARSKALSIGLSNAHFKSLGLPSLIEAR